MPTELELPRPHRLGRVRDDPLRKVALHAADHVMCARLPAFADDTEGVVLHDGRAADAAQQTLLHAAVKLEDRHFGRGLNLRREFWRV